MEFHLKDLAKAAGQIRAIERRVRQLWALAASLMITLAVVVVSAQLARPEPWPGNGLPEEIRWGAIVIGILLAAGYLWSRMRELLRALPGARISVGDGGSGANVSAACSAPASFPVPPSAGRSRGGTACQASSVARSGAWSGPWLGA